MINFKKNIIISLMGVDGSGKTTLAKLLVKKINDSQYLHLKPYIIFLDRRTVIKNPHLQKKSTIILSLLRLISWLMSYKVFFYNKKNNKFFIFDRYAHDILIDPLRYQHGLSKKLTKLILDLFPQPDLWIFLKPSIKTIKSRKTELSDKELEHQIKGYVRFFKPKKNVLLLDSNMSKKILINKIIKKINS